LTRSLPLQSTITAPSVEAKENACANQQQASSRDISSWGGGTTGREGYSFKK
jgi:hypothetical protein